MLSLSSQLVASSSSRTRGLRISAWAITIRWVSPPEVTLALAPTQVSIPIGMAAISLSTEAIRAAAEASSAVASSLSPTMLSQMSS